MTKRADTSSEENINNNEDMFYNITTASFHEA